jgi:hypothetical protein
VAKVGLQVIFSGGGSTPAVAKVGLQVIFSAGGSSPGLSNA